MSRPVPVGAAVIAAAFVAGAASACIDTGAPKSSGIASISLLQLAAPSVVMGDVLRDSSGAPAPLRLVAYDEHGVPQTNLIPQFFAIDSSVRVDTDGLVHGLRLDSVGARVAGGAGSLQAPALSVFVTREPNLVASTGATTTPVLTFPAPSATSSPADSLVHSVPFTVAVTSADGKGVRGIVVYFRVVSAPPGIDPSRPTAVITNETGRLSTRDTTDVKGLAARKVTFLHRRATGDLVAGVSTDTVHVAATVLYRGADISGSPVLFKVPVRRQ